MLLLALGLSRGPGRAGGCMVALDMAAVEFAIRTVSLLPSSSFGFVECLSTTSSSVLPRGAGVALAGGDFFRSKSGDRSSLLADARKDGSLYVVAKPFKDSVGLSPNSALLATLIGLPIVISGVWW